MEEKPRQSQTEKIEIGGGSVGHLVFRGRNVHYNLNVETAEDINAQNPAEFQITQDLALRPAKSRKPSFSISIWIWEGVPEKFKEILLYHELCEADLMVSQRKTKKEAHQAARIAHMQYAQDHFNLEHYREFIEWQKTIGLS